MGADGANLAHTVVFLGDAGQLVAFNPPFVISFDRGGDCQPGLDMGAHDHLVYIVTGFVYLLEHAFRKQAAKVVGGAVVNPVFIRGNVAGEIYFGFGNMQKAVCIAQRTDLGFG